MSLFGLLSRWFWVLCIAVTFFNAATAWLNAKRRIESRPELRKGYRTLTRALATWGNLPWLVMGFGCTYGRVPSVFSFFRPRDGNPYVLVFFCAVFLVWVVGTYWLMFRGGAQMLVDHPGFLSIEAKSPRAVMAIWFVCILGGAVAVVWMFFGNFPVPT